MLRIAKLSLEILLVYLLWYTQAFGNAPIVLYGATVVATAFVALDMVRRERVDLKVLPWGIWVNLVMVVYSVITGIFIAKSPEALAKSVSTFFAFSMITVDIAWVAHAEDSVDWLIKTLIVSAVMCCYRVSFHGVYETGYGMVMSPNNNPNTLGLMMIAGIFAIAFYAGMNMKRVIPGVMLSGWMFYTVVNCGSRKGMIGGLAILVLWIGSLWLGAVKRGDRSTVLAVTGIVLTVAVVGILFYRNVYHTTDISKRMAQMANESSNDLRVSFYREAIEHLAEHPLFGIGLDQFRQYNSAGFYSHSVYAEAIADWGIIGSLIYFLPAVVAPATAVRLLLAKADFQRCGILISLIIVEMFMGVGQIWFYDALHMTVWGIIYIVLNRMQTASEGRVVKEPVRTGRGKYIKQGSTVV